MMNKIVPLVITPELIMGESFHGFVLRTSEMNGYSSPGDMLRYAGLSENEIRSVRLATDKLACLFGRSQDCFEEHAYVKKEEFTSLNTFHVFGHELPASHLSIKEQKVCPQCIQEQGYIDAFWDLKISTVCPLHGLPAITHCPSCKKRLSWFRPGLLECSCGAKITPEECSPIVNEAVLPLLEIVWRKLHTRPLRSENTEIAGLPLEQLERMSLRTLLGVVERFEHLGRKSKSDDPVFENLPFASQALGNWPHGFFDFLETIGATWTPGQGSAGLAKQFLGFQTAFLKAELPTEEISFIWNAFGEFGTKRWKKGLIDRKLKGVEGSASSTVGGITEVARRIGVQPETVRRLVETGVLEAITVERGGKPRLLFDMNQSMPRRTKKGKSLGPREAARRLEIPISVLQALRSNRVYKVRWLGKRLGSFHESDVEQFRNKLLQLAACRKPTQLVQSRNHLATISEIMRMKAGDPAAKAQVIKQMLTGSLTVLGRDTDGPGGLLVNRDDAVAVATETAIKRSRSLYTYQVAKKLGCDPLVVPWLVENLLLEGRYSARGLKVTTESVSAFDAEYISCAGIAKEMGTTTRRIAEQCRIHKLHILNAERGYGKAAQPFVRRADVKCIGHRSDLELAI